MSRSVRVALPFVLASLLAGTAACADDGAGVRGEPAGTTVSGLGSGSGSGSGSGLGSDDNSGVSDDPDVQAGAVTYRSYVLDQMSQLLTASTAFTDAVRAGDLAKAQALFAPSRVSWERIEPIAGLVPDIDGEVDARVDDFESVDDPDWTGWHRLEYLLFDQQTTEGTTELATKLDEDLGTLSSTLQNLPIALSDFQANIDGSQAVVTAFTAAPPTLDPDLLVSLTGKFQAVYDGLAPYRLGDGSFAAYDALAAADKTTLQAALATLAEDLALLPAALGLS